MLVLLMKAHDCPGHVTRVPVIKILTISGFCTALDVAVTVDRKA